MALGTALTRVATRTGLSPTWTRAGSTLAGALAGDFLGDGLGVTISSTTHCVFPADAGGLNRWIRTAISLSGSIVPRCEDPNSFMSVTDMSSFMVLNLDGKNALPLLVRLCVWTSLHCLGEFFFQGRQKSVEGKVTKKIPFSGRDEVTEQKK
jgi:hypothetical protein